MATVQQLPLFPSATSQSLHALGTRLTAKEHRVKAMSGEFEGMFLSQLLKEMRATLQPGGFFAGDHGDIHGGLFDMVMSKHLADAGGVGLATKLQQLLRTTTSTGTTTSNATTTTQRNSAVAGPAVSGASGS